MDVQVPPCFGGLGAQAVYVDTEGSFLLQRLVDLAAAAVRHCSLLAEDEEQRVAMETFTAETVLSNVFLVTARACVLRSRDSRSEESPVCSLSGPLS